MNDVDHQIKKAQQFMSHGKLFEALMQYKDLIDVPLEDAAKRRIRKHFEFCLSFFVEESFLKSSENWQAEHLYLYGPGIIEMMMGLMLDGVPVLRMVDRGATAIQEDGIFEGTQAFIFRPSPSLLNPSKIEDIRLNFQLIQTPAGPFFRWIVTIVDNPSDPLIMETFAYLYRTYQPMALMALTRQVDFLIASDPDGLGLFRTDEILKITIKLDRSFCSGLREALDKACLGLKDKLDTYGPEKIQPYLKQFQSENPLEAYSE